MRASTLAIATALLVSSAAVAQDIGTITYDIKSGGADALTFAPGNVPATIPIEVYSSATTGGVDGPNNGVAGVFLDIIGNALQGQIQQPLTLKNKFIKNYIPGVSDGLGFGVWTSGFGSLATIGGIGGAQRGPLPGPGPTDMPGAFTANAPDASGQPPVLWATGTLILAQGVMNAGGTFTVQTDNVEGHLWIPATGRIENAITIGDTITITVPEPAGILLLAAGTFPLLLRRRRV